MCPNDSHYMQRQSPGVWVCATCGHTENRGGAR